MELQQALARTLRGPMARFWRTTGLFGLLLMLLPVVLQLYVLWLLPQLSPFHNSGHPLYDRQIALAHNMLAYPVAVVVWLLAALRVNRGLSDFLDHHPLPQNPLLVLTRLKYSALHGWPVLLLLGLVYRLNWYIFAPSSGEWQPSLPRLAAILSGWESAAGLAVGMLWVLGILAAAPRRTMLPIVLSIFIVALPHLHGYAANMRDALSSVPLLPPSDGAYPAWGSLLSWLLGLLGAALCLLTRVAGRHMLSWSLGLVLILSSVSNLVLDYLPYWYVVPYSMSFLGGLSSFTFRTLAEAGQLSDSGFLLRIMLPLPASAEVPYGYFPLHLGLNACFVWLHYLLVQWCFAAGWQSATAEPEAVRGMLAEAGE